MKEKVAILLATYNGEQYLQEQLESVLKSSYKNFKIFIRDDGSKDKTCEIIKEYSETYPDQFYWVKDRHQIKSAQGNFMQLFRFAKDLKEFSYFMCMDQDDVWHKNKIEITLCTLKKVENEYGKDKPVLVHTDLNVIDQKGELIAQSFIKYSMISPRVTKFSRMLAYNNVTGCTMMMNRSLLEMCICDSKDIFMHDWWCALIASAFGKIVFVNQQTIDYRQHLNNTVGASNNKSFFTVFRKFQRFLKKVHRGETLFDKTISQARRFRKHFIGQMSERQRELTETYCSLCSIGRVKRLYIIFKYNFWSQGIVRRIGQIAYLILKTKTRLEEEER